MKQENLPEQNYEQPVAYDAQGQPLYAHPPKVTAAPVPQVVHLARPVEPSQLEVSPEIKAKHERSRRAYPTLNLSAGEYVMRAVRRHPIGLVLPLSVGALLITAALILLAGYDTFAESLRLSGAASEASAAVAPVLLFCLLIAAGMAVVYYIYISNKFFMTNESVIQEIQVSLFSRLEQTVSLANIEDASYTQKGILQHLFNYGDIRLSTEGDETTYRFTYVANPKMHIATLNNAVEAFKNGRPVEDN